MIRRPPRSTLFPTRRSSDLGPANGLFLHFIHVDKPGSLFFQQDFPRLCHSQDRKSTRLNSSHQIISYAVFCLKKKKMNETKESHKHRVTEDIRWTNEPPAS